MALAEVSELQELGMIQAEALMVTAEYNTPGISAADRLGLRSELDGSLAVIQEYLRDQAEHLDVDLSDVRYPGERDKALLADFDMDEVGRLLIPRSCITAITLRALWGIADCNPVADVRVITEEDRRNPVHVYGRGPLDPVGKWSRFPLGRLVL